MNQKGKDLDKSKNRKKTKLQPVSKSKYRNLKTKFAILSEDDDDDNDIIIDKPKRSSRQDDSFDE
jgi:phage I-like protein